MYKHNEQRTEQYSNNFTDDKVYKKLLPDCKVIFDIGANFGQSIKKFKSIWPDCVIHAFEPLPECQKTLKELSDQYHDVHIHEMAVGAVCDYKQFYKPEVQIALTSIYRINPNSRDSLAINAPDLAGVTSEEYLKGINNTFSANVTTLDDFCKKNSIVPDFVKMDIQGSESAVLAGAINTLPSVRMLQMEVMLYDLYEHKTSFFDIEKYTRSNFELYDIFHIAKNPMNGRTDWIDVIYKNIKKSG